MNRRHFFRTSFLGGLGVASLSGACASSSVTRREAGPRTAFGDLGHDRASYDLDLSHLAAQYRRELFDEYLPFWENGGFDEERGGFMCYLFDDGTVQDDRKDIWYQGRAIWVYAFLYNNLDRNSKWLDIAQKSRDFMVNHMHRGDGTWIDTVNRFGEPVAGIDPSRDGNIYGALFAAAGLIQLAKATGNQEDLDLAKLTLRKSMLRYGDPSYPGVVLPDEDVNRLRTLGHSVTGLRAQGHSFMMVWVVPQLLHIDSDDEFEKIAEEHLNLISNRFWNPDYGISNETLFHNYERIPGFEDQMVPGHSIETQWMAMVTAQQFGHERMADEFGNRMRRLTEMSWDYVYGGIGDTDFRVFAGEEKGIGADFSIKTMWAQTEVLVGAMKLFAKTDTASTRSWAADWHNRAWEFLQRTMPTGTGVWRQAVDRRGNGIDRPGISIHRKGNFHQPRCLMMNLLEIERMIAAG